MAAQSNNWVIAIIAVIIITGIAMHRQQTIVGRSSFTIGSTEYPIPNCRMIGDSCVRSTSPELRMADCCSNAYCVINRGERIGTCVDMAQP